jgi:hypothetical protein
MGHGLDEMRLDEMGGKGVGFREMMESEKGLRDG